MNNYSNVEFRNCKRSSLLASISKSLESLRTFSLILFPVKTLRLSSLSLVFSLSLGRFFLSRFSLCFDLRRSLSRLRERDGERWRVWLRSYERDLDLWRLCFVGCGDSVEVDELDEEGLSLRRPLGVYEGVMSHTRNTTASSPICRQGFLAATVTAIVPLLSAALAVPLSMVGTARPGAPAVSVPVPVLISLTSMAASWRRARPVVSPVPS